MKQKILSEYMRSGRIFFEVVFEVILVAKSVRHVRVMAT